MAQTPHRRSATSSSSSQSAATRDGALERYFGIRRYGSSLRTELLAGLATFLAAMS